MNGLILETMQQARTVLLEELLEIAHARFDLYLLAGAIFLGSSFGNPELYWMWVVTGGVTSFCLGSASAKMKRAKSYLKMSDNIIKEMQKRISQENLTRRKE